MRTMILSLAVLLVMAGCAKRTETTVTSDETSTIETSTSTVSATVPEVSVDTSATAEVRDDVAAAGREVVKDVKEAGRAAAQATGTALEKAGKKIQEKAKPQP
ncbi:MAG TPA: hypothetical protein VMS98_20325 [Thermoanaerobaculia bacterium]|nr:hypothetical protein [Thermoanaerobaculia bacterium]